MLQRLTISDFVLVERLELEFAGGFGTLTGETGAGKSILVDALAFVLGERGDAGLVRAGAARAEVVAEFLLDDAPVALAWLRDNDLDGENGLLVRRLVDANGRSRVYLNGSPATAQQVREVAEALVDIHGQHAHQSLLRSDAQRQLVDAHARLTPSVERVAQAWREWRAAQEGLAAARSGAVALAGERDQLAWQVQELVALGFSADEWEQLNQEHRRLAHAASLVEGARQCLSLLSEEDGAAVSQLDAAAARLAGMADFDPQVDAVVALLASAQAELSEAVSSLNRYADRLELDPQRLREIEQRIEAVLACARKFRAVPEELPGLLARWQARLAELGESADIGALEARLTAARERYAALAAQLSAARAKAAAKMGREVSQVMQQLALGGGSLEVALVPLAEGNSSGLEQIEFRIGGLAGSEAKPLAKVASGGELSRISLAIQVVTSQAARVPTLIFDEVDVGIGGGVAEVVGRLLRGLGAERQVLCVTHLPQVAARANWQWCVVKEQENGVARSHVRPLDAAGRVEEIARMLGGVVVTEITRQHAQEMLAAG